MASQNLSISEDAVAERASTSGPAVASTPTTRDYKFWLVFLGIGIATLITALEVVSTGTLNFTSRIQFKFLR